MLLFQVRLQGSRRASVGESCHTLTRPVCLALMFFSHLEGKMDTSRVDKAPHRTQSQLTSRHNVVVSHGSKVVSPVSTRVPWSSDNPPPPRRRHPIKVQQWGTGAKWMSACFWCDRWACPAREMIDDHPGGHVCSRARYMTRYRGDAASSDDPPARPSGRSKWWSWSSNRSIDGRIMWPF